jgi:tetratricopeptide (TPR) repeat protein
MRRLIQPAIALLVTALCLGFVGLASARTAGPVGACFDDYEAGRYEDAAGCFLLHAAEGGERFDAHLLYNTGNAYHREGRYAEAIWAYRLALLDLPRDGDLRANLDTARAKAVDDLPAPLARGAVGRALLAPYDSLSGREMLLLGTIAWALFFIGLAVRVHRPFSFGTMGALPLLGLVAVLGLVGHVARSRQIESRPVAVVIVDEVTLRSGRDLRSVDLARIHAGAEIAVIAKDAPWIQVRLGEDLRGWIPDTAVALVRPGALR